MKIKKGDTILIIAGKDRGKKGKVLRVHSQDAKIAVEGINILKKHVRPRKSGEKGQVIEIPAPFGVSKAKVVCPKCGKATRVGYKIEGKTKTRMCKSCGAAM
ncbi:MAG: 50S ribosomal protein L24 [Candidatus Yanofskybacteria bacterium]|nr:50S ribosomal protein L24 [Candidatus Yanofskybacteria bacterium]